MVLVALESPAQATAPAAATALLLLLGLRYVSQALRNRGDPIAPYFRTEFNAIARRSAVFDSQMKLSFMARCQQLRMGLYCVEVSERVCKFTDPVHLVEEGLLRLAWRSNLRLRPTTATRTFLARKVFAREGDFELLDVVGKTPPPDVAAIGEIAVVTNDTTNRPSGQPARQRTQQRSLYHHHHHRRHDNYTQNDRQHCLVVRDTDAIRADSSGARWVKLFPTPGRRLNCISAL